MQELEALKKRLTELFASGEVNRVLAWKKGETQYDPEPAFFYSADELEELVYSDFCAANLSKYMIEASRLEGKTAVLLKPCDTYSFNQLLTEHRVVREKAYIIGVGCSGKLDMNKIRKQGIRGIVEDGIENVSAGDDAANEAVEGGSGTKLQTLIRIHTVYGDKTVERKSVMLERCHVCKGKEHRVYDELFGESTDTKDSDRFAEVERIEKLSPKERFEFFDKELSRCIRCNACRNVCPACSCVKCVFDGEQFDEAKKVNSDSFEEKMFHIIRAFHVAGRCTDCGECSRVCPQNIPLHLFNRKFIKDINEFYGEYAAGFEAGSVSPLTRFETDDPEPSVAERSGGR